MASSIKESPRRLNDFDRLIVPTVFAVSVRRAGKNDILRRAAHRRDNYSMNWREGSADGFNGEVNGAPRPVQNNKPAIARQ
jgi:hypothetical protein